MKKQYIVEGAMCMCKFGTTPAMIKVLDQKIAKANGDNLIATNMNLGNVFEAPAFTTCNMNPIFPRPCAPAIIMWTGEFAKLKINKLASPLTGASKGTCAAGCPACIEFITTGQKALPSAPQMKNATAEMQGELDPTGEPLALTEHQIDSFMDILIQ